MREVVIAMGGAFNPVHTQHVAVMVEAKRFLENYGGGGQYKVIEGCLAPAHDGYVKRKMEKKGELAIEGSERIRMCNLATQDLDWMKPCQVTYGSALEGARKLFPNKECIVILGADRAKTKNGSTKWSRQNKKFSKEDPFITTLIVGRPGDVMDSLVKEWNNDLLSYTLIKNGYALAPPIVSADVSSTEVRRLISSLSSLIISNNLNNSHNSNNSTISTISTISNDSNLNDSNLRESLLRELLVDSNLMSGRVVEYILQNLGIFFK